MLLPFDVLVAGFTCEDDVGGMFFRELILDGTDRSSCRLLSGRSCRVGWWRRREGLALGDSSEQVALPSSVVGWLCTTVELAWGVEGLLEGEGMQPCSLAAPVTLGGGSSSRLLIFDCCYVPAVGSRLLGLALVVVRLAPVGVTSRRLGSRREHLPGRVHSEL